MILRNMGDLNEFRIRAVPLDEEPYQVRRSQGLSDPIQSGVYGTLWQSGQRWRGRALDRTNDQESSCI
jgi:hypothetical protein